MTGLLLAMGQLLACGKDDSRPAGEKKPTANKIAQPTGTEAERDFVNQELTELKAALAARDASKVSVGCSSATVSIGRMPAPLAAQISRLCYLEAPRLYLALSVAEARKGAAKNPGMPDLTCMQLFAEDAFEILKKHPTKDAGLQKLAAEYTRLCPKKVAGFRASGKTKRP